MDVEHHSRNALCHMILDMPASETPTGTNGHTKHCLKFCANIVRRGAAYSLRHHRARAVQPLQRALCPLPVRQEGGCIDVPAMKCADAQPSATRLAILRLGNVGGQSRLQPSPCTGHPPGSHATGHSRCAHGDRKTSSKQLNRGHVSLGNSKTYWNCTT